jgi:hypothetical protein
MMRNYNNISDSNIKEFRHKFEVTMKTILHDFGPNAFAKYKYENNNLALQSRFNSAVFDALAISCHDLIFNEAKHEFIKNKSGFLDLFKNPEFYESISGSYLDVNKLRFRIEQTKIVLR